MALVFKKGKQNDKKEVATKFVKVILTTASIKSLSQIACKILAIQCFYTGLLGNKIVNRTTCKMQMPESSF